MSQTAMWKKGEIHLIKGQCVFTCISGSAMVMGALLKEKDSVEIPQGKGLPIECVSDAEFSLETGEGFEEEMLSESSIPKAWDDLVEKIVFREEKTCGKLLVFGSVDTGKSFFTCYLSNRLLSAGKTVGIIDCDTGQSDVGAPGTYGLSILKFPIFSLSAAPLDEMFFVGSHSPVLHIAPCLTAFDRLIRSAENRVDILIIDTTGLIFSDAGRMIKQAKIDLCNPEWVVALQREDEVEHLLRFLPEEKIVRLQVSKSATSTSPQLRQSLREEISKDAFRDAREIILENSKTDRCFLFTGKPFSEKKHSFPSVHAELLPGWEGILFVLESPVDKKVLQKAGGVYRSKIRTFIQGEEKGIFVGLLNKNGVCLGVGIILSIDYQKRIFRIHSSISNEKEITTVQFGSLRYSKEGFEAGFVTPGRY